MSGFGRAKSGEKAGHEVLSKPLETDSRDSDYDDDDDNDDDSERAHWTDVARAFLMYEDFMLMHIENRQLRLNNLTEGALFFLM